MFKIAGMIMIILSGTILGFSKSANLKKRQESLGKTLYSLGLMENEISYGKCCMDKLFERISKLGGIAFDEKGDSAGDVFLCSVKKLTLDPEETEVLERFSKSLGTLDSASQLKNIKNTVKTLELLEENAKESYEKYGKMYRSMGLLTSVLAVIILI